MYADVVARKTLITITSQFYCC